MHGPRSIRKLSLLLGVVMLATAIPAHAVEGDTTPPIATGPDPIVAEATDPQGAWVYLETELEIVDESSVFGSCYIVDPWEPLEFYGAWFPIGSTSIECYLDDIEMNQSTVNRVVHVTGGDTVPPVIEVVADPLVAQSEPYASDGAYAYIYGNLTVDDPSAVPDCGGVDLYFQWFPKGDTSVTCTATDQWGNTSDPVTFTVSVVDPSEYYALEMWLVAAKVDKAGVAHLTMGMRAQQDGFIYADAQIRQLFAKRFYIDGSSGSDWIGYTAGEVAYLVFDVEAFNGLFGPGRAELDYTGSICSGVMHGICDWTGFVETEIRLKRGQNHR